MISYGDMLDVVDAETKKNAPATVVQLPKTETKEKPKKEEKEEIEDVIEDGEKEEVEENEN